MRAASPIPAGGPSGAIALTAALLIGLTGPAEAGRLAGGRRTASSKVAPAAGRPSEKPGLVNRLLRRGSDGVPHRTGSRQVGALRGDDLARRFPGLGPEPVDYQLRKGRWRPSPAWLAREGKTYGRLLIVNDLHPASGRDPVTRKVAPVEDFKPSEQEPDFAAMLAAQWQQVAERKSQLTLVLNGDTLEFMQTERIASGQTYDGDSDAFGPLNTPALAVGKLDAIWDGHPVLFGAYADHLVRGHRLVLTPGNHDRQLLHPTVLKRFRQRLAGGVAERLLADPTFAPGAGVHKRKRLARAAARARVAAQFEFHPWFFMLGDVVSRHGNETDRYNQFSTPFGEHYHPGARDAPLEAALGDYVVKALINRAERQRPWTDNVTSAWAITRAVLAATGGNPAKIGRLIRYLLTREGVDRSPAAQARAATRLRADVVREVRARGLLGKFNELRPAELALDEAGLVELLLDYEGQAARASLTGFDRAAGTASRLGRLLTRLRGFFGGATPEGIEQTMTDRLFAEYVSTVVVGHDHLFRYRPRLAVGPDGQVARVELLDAATWVDWVPGARDRERGFTPTARRGLVVVDFDAEGSHPKLMNFDPVRGFQKIDELESEAEAEAAALR